MDDLRHGTGDDELDETYASEPNHDIDADVLDRLSAYGHGLEGQQTEDPERAVDDISAFQAVVDDAPDRAVEETRGFEETHAAEAAHAVEEGHAVEEAHAVEETLAVEETHAVDEAHAVEETLAVGEAHAVEEAQAVEEDHAVEVVLEADSEPDASEVGTIAPGPSEPERRRRLALRQPRERQPARTKTPKDRRPKKLVGLKIGASQIAAAQIVNNGAPELVEIFREPLEPGLVVSGEIRDADALGDALRRFFDLHKLPKRGVRLGLANNRIGVRVFEIEGVTDPVQLENAIRFRAEEVLPIPLDQAVLDYVVLEDVTRDDGTPVKRILLVVAYREVVDRYLQACRGAGLQVVGIDLEAFALLRALEAPADRDSASGALVAVAIGHDRTTIAVSTGRLCEFTRVLDWGGWSLNVAIARELDKAPSEVEAIKRQLSFARDTEVEGLTAAQVTKTRDGVQRALAGFTRELVASLHFYQAQPGALGIGEVVLTGGTAHMDGLPEAVGELVGVPIRLGDPFKRVKVGPNVAHDAQPGSVAVAIGLGIED